MGRGKVEVGSYVSVFWELDKKWYNAEVLEFDPATETCKVLYTDGEREEFKLSEIKYRKLWGGKLRERDKAADGLSAKKQLEYIVKTLLDIEDRLPQRGVHTNSEKWWEDWHLAIVKAERSGNVRALVHGTLEIAAQMKDNVSTSWWKSQSVEWKKQVAEAKDCYALGDSIFYFLTRAVDWAAARQLFENDDSPNDRDSLKVEDAKDAADDQMHAVAAQSKERGSSVPCSFESSGALVHKESPLSPSLGTGKPTMVKGRTLGLETGRSDSIKNQAVRRSKRKLVEEATGKIRAANASASEVPGVDYTSVEDLPFSGRFQVQKRPRGEEDDQSRAGRRQQRGRSGTSKSAGEDDEGSMGVLPMKSRRRKGSLAHPNEAEQDGPLIVDVNSPTHTNSGLKRKKVDGNCVSRDVGPNTILPKSLTVTGSTPGTDAVGLQEATTPHVRQGRARKRQSTKKGAVREAERSSSSGVVEISGILEKRKSSSDEAAQQTGLENHASSSSNSSKRLEATSKHRRKIAVNSTDLQQPGCGGDADNIIANNFKVTTEVPQQVDKAFVVENKKIGRKKYSIVIATNTSENVGDEVGWGSGSMQPPQKSPNKLARVESQLKFAITDNSQVVINTGQSIELARESGCAQQHPEESTCKGPSVDADTQGVVVTDMCGFKAVVESKKRRGRMKSTHVVVPSSPENVGEKSGNGLDSKYQPPQKNPNICAVQVEVEVQKEGGDVLPAEYFPGASVSGTKKKHGRKKKSLSAEFSNINDSMAQHSGIERVAAKATEVEAEPDKLCNEGEGKANACHHFHSESRKPPLDPALNLEEELAVKNNTLATPTRRSRKSRNSQKSVQILASGEEGNQSTHQKIANESETALLGSDLSRADEPVAKSDVTEARPKRQVRPSRKALEAGVEDHKGIQVAGHSFGHEGEKDALCSAGKLEDKSDAPNATKGKSETHCLAHCEAVQEQINEQQNCQGGQSVPDGTTKELSISALNSEDGDSAGSDTRASIISTKRSKQGVVESGSVNRTGSKRASSGTRRKGKSPKRITLVQGIATPSIKKHEAPRANSLTVGDTTCQSMEKDNGEDPQNNNGTTESERKGRYQNYVSKGLVVSRIGIDGQADQDLQSISLTGMPEQHLHVPSGRGVDFSLDIEKKDKSLKETHSFELGADFLTRVEEESTQTRATLVSGLQIGSVIDKELTGSAAKHQEEGGEESGEDGCDKKVDSLKHELSWGERLPSESSDGEDGTTVVESKCDQALKQEPLNLEQTLVSMTVGEEVCALCDFAGADELMLLCDGDECNCALHTFCLNPPLQSIPEGQWLCPHCSSLNCNLSVSKRRVKKCSSSRYPQKVMQAILGRRTEPLKDEGKNLGKTKVQYLVKWDSLSHQHDTWIPEDWILFMDNRLVTSFQRKYLSSHGSGSSDIDERRPEWLLVGRVLGCRRGSSRVDVHPSQLVGLDLSAQAAKGDLQFLVKWEALDYKYATWEEVNDSKTLQEAVSMYVARHTNAANFLPPGPEAKSVANNMKCQPNYIQGGVMYEYQLQGLKWLVANFEQKRSVILADEMGLGKTVQAVAFVASLRYEKLSTRPVLVIAPKSTLPGWEQEIRCWAPGLNAVVYQGDKENRALIRKYEFYTQNKDPMFEVLVTSYELATLDNSLLCKFHWASIIVDEGHRVKNVRSKLGTLFKRHTADFRLLLTGTPVQNTLAELFALLHFLDPTEFPDPENAAREFTQVDAQGSTSASDAKGVTQQLSRLHELLRPRMLRRLKAEVLRDMIPGKKMVEVSCALTELQRHLYVMILKKNYKVLNKGVRSGQKRSLNTVLIDLKMACNHPYLFPEKEPQGLGPAEAFKLLVGASGKLQLLEQLLPLLKERGHRVLLFSQMTKMLDILEDFLGFLRLSYSRIDGSSSAVERQKSIEEFNDPESSTFIFLISTRAGGLGINLPTADTVIIYDPDFNPFVDIQAQARAHRIGQERTVLVYQLVTKCSVEEKILQRSQKKLAMENLVMSSAPKETASDINAILLHGARKVLDEQDIEATAITYTEESVKKLLDRTISTSATDITDGQGYLGAVQGGDFLSQVNKEGEQNLKGGKESNWTELLKNMAEEDEKEDLGRGKRLRKQVKYVVEPHAEGHEDDEYNPSSSESSSGSESSLDSEGLKMRTSALARKAGDPVQGGVNEVDSAGFPNSLASTSFSRQVGGSPVPILPSAFPNLTGSSPYVSPLLPNSHSVASRISSEAHSLPSTSCTGTIPYPGLFGGETSSHVMNYMQPRSGFQSGGAPTFQDLGPPLNVVLPVTSKAAVSHYLPPIPTSMTTRVSERPKSAKVPRASPPSVGFSNTGLSSTPPQCLVPNLQGPLASFSNTNPLLALATPHTGFQGFPFYPQNSVPTLAHPVIPAFQVPLPPSEGGPANSVSETTSAFADLHQAIQGWKAAFENQRISAGSGRFTGSEAGRSAGEELGSISSGLSGSFSVPAQQLTMPASVEMESPNVVAQELMSDPRPHVSRMTNNSSSFPNSVAPTWLAGFYNVPFTPHAVSQASGDYAGSQFSSPLPDPVPISKKLQGPEVCALPSSKDQVGVCVSSHLPVDSSRACDSERPLVPVPPQVQSTSYLIGTMPTVTKHPALPQEVKSSSTVDRRLKLTDTISPVVSKALTSSSPTALSHQNLDPLKSPSPAPKSKGGASTSRVAKFAQPSGNVIQAKIGEHSPRKEASRSTIRRRKKCPSIKSDARRSSEKSPKSLVSRKDSEILVDDGGADAEDTFVEVRGLPYSEEGSIDESPPPDACRQDGVMDFGDTSELVASQSTSLSISKPMSQGRKPLWVPKGDAGLLMGHLQEPLGISPPCLPRLGHLKESLETPPSNFKQTSQPTAESGTQLLTSSHARII